MQRRNLAAFGVLGLAGAGLATVAALVASGQDSPTPGPVAPADQVAVVQVTDAPTSSPALTTTKAQVRTTEQAEAPAQRTVRAAADEPGDTASDPTGEQTLAPGETSTTEATQYHPITTTVIDTGGGGTSPCAPDESSPDCLDDGWHNGSS